MIRRILLIMAVLAALVLAALPASAAEADGAIHGTIVNGTTGILPDTPLTVTLNTYNNGTFDISDETQASADGVFAFEGLNTDAAYTYILQATYNGVTFTGTSLSFESGQTLVIAEMDIYETTEDLSVLSVSTMHAIAYTSQGPGVTVTEVYFLDNSSNLAFTGILAFTLPPDAAPSDMAANLVWTTVSSGSAVVDTVPIPPGTVQINFTYTLPASSSYSLSRHVPLAIDQFNLLVEIGSLTVTSPQLSQGQPYNNTFDYYFSNNTLQPGDDLQIVLTPVAVASTNPLGVWLAVIGVVVVVGAGIFFIRSRSNRAEPASGEPAEDNSARWEELLDEIAALDDQLAAGTINEEEYRAVRDRTKAELKELMKHENDEGGD